MTDAAPVLDLQGMVDAMHTSAAAFEKLPDDLMASAAAALARSWAAQLQVEIDRRFAKGQP